MNKCRLAGLVAAVHTPFQPDGSLNLAAVERQAEQLLRHRLEGVFVCGSTGESQSLTCDERRQLARRWMDVCGGTPMQVVVQVGSNCLPEARALASEAAELGVAAISAVAPFYFKPRSLQSLVEWCAAIASAAPNTPFYFYDVPALTHVHFPMPAFLDQAADRIPTLNGIKFTNNDLMAFQLCLRAANGAFDIPWGIDECLLAALALGGTGAVGSTYNFAAPVFQGLLAALARGDLATAREQQQRATGLIQLLLGYEYLGASKLIMKWLGTDVGPCRPPLDNLDAEQAAKLRRELEVAGFFDWAQPFNPTIPVPSVQAARASGLS